MNLMKLLLFTWLTHFVPMGMGTYNYTFKSEVLESVEVKSVKIKKSSEALVWSKKSFVRRVENDTFERVILKG